MLNMEKKLILPAEIKVCATCSYWDGERQIDEELHVVVVAESCKGECLVHETEIGALSNMRTHQGCAWESLSADQSRENSLENGQSGDEQPTSPNLAL